MSMTEQEDQDLVLTIAYGKMVQKCDPGEPGAKIRTWEDSETGEIKEKYEIVHKNLIGRIVGLHISEKQYGPVLVVTLAKGGEKAVLMVQVNSAFFGGFVKKLPNVDFKEEVVLNSWDFIGKNGKPVRTISVGQGGFKVNSHFWDGANHKSVGLPEAPKPWGEMTKEDIQMHYARVTQFLTELVEMYGRDLAGTAPGEVIDSPSASTDLPVGSEPVREPAPKANLKHSKPDLSGALEEFNKVNPPTVYDDDLPF